MYLPSFTDRLNYTNIDLQNVPTPLTPNRPNKSPTLHLKVRASWGILLEGMPTQTGWKSEWQEEHSSSGIPVTPGQKGEHGVNVVALGPLKHWYVYRMYRSIVAVSTPVMDLAT